MSRREVAVSVLETLPDDKVEAFLTLFADENLLARIESEQLANDPDAKRYKNFREFMDEMEQDDAI